MTLTLQEIMDCGAWGKFCRLHGYSEWAINEGGGDTEVRLTIHQAHHLGIVRVTDWKVKSFEEVYPRAAAERPRRDHEDKEPI